MSWILFSILAAIFWAIGNIIDKHVLTKWIRKPTTPVLILGYLGLITSIIVYFTHGFSKLSYLNITLGIVSGFFYALMAIFYFKAVDLQEISRAIPLIYFHPLFILILAFLFLGEIFTFQNYMGIFLLVIGAILISLKKSFKINFGKGFWFMILSAFLLAVSQVMTKYLLNFADYWTIFSYTRIGAAIIIIPMFSKRIPDLIKSTKIYGKRVVSMMFLSTALNLLAVLLITIATAVGYVTLVNSLASIQPFFVLLFAVILSMFFPRILKEEISRSTVLFKFIAIVLMFIGAMLIT